MKIFSLACETIENLEVMNPDSSITFCTVLEFLLDKDIKKKENICIVDNPWKTIQMLNVKILDLRHKGNIYERKAFKYQNLDRVLPKIQDIEEIDWQTRMPTDDIFGEFSFISHLNEYARDFQNFILKLDSRLSGNKEKFEISEKYRPAMKNLFGLSESYQNFKAKKSGSYPPIFNFLKRYLKVFLDAKEENSTEEEPETAQES